MWAAGPGERRREARGQPGIVSAHRAGSDQNPIRAISQDVRVAPGGSTGYPFAVPGSGRDATVQRHRVFGPDQGPAGVHAREIPSMQLTRVGLAETYIDGYARGTQLSNSFTCNSGERVRDCHDTATDTGLNDRANAGWRPAMMATWLQGYIEGCALRPPARLA